MALQLMKLLVTASTTTTINPTQEKYFYVTTAETAAGSTLTIDTTDFFDDAGAEVTDLPELATDNGYYNLFINGVLQMSNISTYTPGETTVGSLEIDVPVGGDPILEGTPIVLEVVYYLPTSTTQVTT
mgnify:FL=1